MATGAAAADAGRADFDAAIAAAGLGPLGRAVPATLQVNVGKRCNQACHHCHVDAGPKRTEAMDGDVAADVVRLLVASPEITTVDLTGGAPELNTQFRTLVAGSRALGRRVIDRCNLTVLSEPGQEDLAEFLASHRVDVVASLPCYGPENVERQRGAGVFARSIDALQRLNALGYAQPGTGLRLDLVYNPAGATLPPPQDALEAQYRAALDGDFGIVFDRLLTVTNMPIKRFADTLRRAGSHEAYMSLLVNHFNAATVPALMCRHLVSVGWDGRLYDCDFNQMLDVPLGAGLRTLRDLRRARQLDGAPIATGPHCFGCTAGSGSSCGGALA